MSARQDDAVTLAIPTQIVRWFSAMPQVLQAMCPKCGHHLRIPASWTDKSVRCKFCQTVFRTPKTSAVTAAPAMQNPAASLKFDEQEGVIVSVRRRKKVRIGIVGVVVLLAACGIGMGFFLELGAANKSTQPKEKEPPMQVAAVKKTEPVGTKIEEPKEKPPMSEEPPPPKKKAPDPSKKAKSPGKKKAPEIVDEPPGAVFPRRALLISVDNYLYFNPLKYGADRDKLNPGSSTRVLAGQLTRAPTHFPATQVTELSDDAAKSMIPVKSVIESAISDFVNGSRAQDRILILFAGHAIDIEKKAYLVPIEGNGGKAKSLIPLSWVYDQLAKSKARQKVLVLDIARFPPARGEELPGTGPLSDDFEKELATPPAGVQVWCSCSKDQQSIELENGSVFLQSLCKVLQTSTEESQPADPVPIQALADKVNSRLKEILAQEKLEQVSRVTGKEAAGGANYDDKEPLPPKLVLKPPLPPPGGDASRAEVAGIFEEINLLPPARSTQPAVKLATLPAFAADVLDPYKADYDSLEELRRKVTANTDKYALRAAVLAAAKAMQSTQIAPKERLMGNGGPIDAKVKEAFLKDQKKPGLSIFELDRALGALLEAGQMRDNESSKRWQANFDFAQARLESRLVYLYEYDFVLAQVRGDNLPKLEPFHNGWRLGARAKVQIPESKVRSLVKNIAKTWKKIGDDYPDTPWAILAERESHLALGLEWRATRD